MATSLRFLTTLAVFFLALSFTLAQDPSPLQDFCVAIPEPENALFVNGRFCKNPNLTNANDFLFTGLNIPRNTSNAVGSIVTQVFVVQFLGLNTLGIAMERIDYAIGGLNPPHTHPRATEVLRVQEGTLFAGFVASNQNNNRLFSMILRPGDVFIFPKGMIHFQLNIGKTSAVAFSVLNSQNPGVITIATALFNATPPINPVVLAKALLVDVPIIEEIQQKFA